MNIEQLQYLCGVARSSSITTAAEKLYVTQQTISRSIGKLEKELGFQLLNRNYKGVSLTEDGKVFVEKAEKVLALFQELYFVNSPSADQTEYSGEIKIYCSDYFNYRIAPKLITYFSEHYPNVQLHLEEHIAKDAAALVLESNHLGYITTFDEQVGYSSAIECLAQLETINVYDDEILILCSKTHPLAEKEAADLTDLGRYPIILSSNPGIENIFAREYNVDLNVLMYSSSMASTVGAIQSNTIGLTTKSIVAAVGLPANIAILPIVQKPQAKNRFIYSKDHTLSPLEKEIIKQSSRILANF